MNFFSTRNNKIKYSFSDLIVKNIPSDGGLFIPKKIFKINFNKNSYYYIIKKLLNSFLSKKEFNKLNIKKIIKNIYKKKNTPIKKIKNKKIFILNLNKGKTFSFKDFSISFIIELISNLNKNISIITATSGDTGASSSFYCSYKEKLKNIILSPYKGISEFQESQMYGILSKNIFNISIKGNFDDCQKIVKKKLINKKLCTINSINFIRIILQSAYYIKYSNLIYKKYKKKPYFCIPTGNFGNAFSCFLANLISNKIKGSVVSNNENNYLYRLFKKFKVVIKKTIKTDCPSIDINIPSNLERYIYYLVGNYKCNEFYKKNKYIKQISNKNKFFSFCFYNKNERKNIIKKIYDKNKIIIDTHTSNSFLSLHKKKHNKNIYVIVNTANFIKFKKNIEKFINKKININYYNKILSIRKKFYFFDIKDKYKINNFIDKNNE
ncbi:pyridoxal-phosphate dependent enzyme [Candidatus Vidania fulgoroideorum]